MSSIRKADPGSSLQFLVPFIVLAVLCVPALMVWGALVLSGQDVPLDPSTALVWLVKGKVVWTTRAWVVLAVETVLVFTLALVGAVWLYRRRREGFAERAWLMSQERTLDHISLDHAASKADQWGITAPGIVLGNLVNAPEVQVAMTWEDVSVTIAGMRSGKTTSVAIPIMADAPGPVIATSIRSEIFLKTAGIRAQKGTLWVFDPMQIISSQPPEWWWDLLSACPNVRDAMEMAAQLVTASRTGQVKGDFWDSEAIALLAYMLVAANRGGKQLDQVFDWVNDDSNDEAVRILKSHGLTEAARSLTAVMNTDPRTRSGVYVTAKQAMNWYTDPEIAQWVTCPPDADRYEHRFNPTAFAMSSDTVYMLSEQHGGGGPLVAAFTLTLCKAAARTARAQGEFLPLPMEVVLDECANICRINQLPDLMSYFGGHHINLHPIFQNYQQIVDNWGKEGAGRLFSSANFLIVGAGVNDDEFLSGVSKLVGEFDRASLSRSSSWQGNGSVSRSVTKESIMPVSELRQIPKHHAIVFATATAPVAIKLQPYFEDPVLGPLVQASVETYSHLVEPPRIEAVITDD